MLTSTVFLKYVYLNACQYYDYYCEMCMTIYNIFNKDKLTLEFCSFFASFPLNDLGIVDKLIN